MSTLDEGAGYAEIINHPFARYEQYGRFFNVAKREVDPKTGAVLGTVVAAPQVVVPEMDLLDADAAPEPSPETVQEPEAPSESVEAGPVPDEIEGLDLADIDLREAHWTHLRQYLKAFGQEYEGKDEALEYLETIQKMQRG
jgi:hypothetical protein